MAPNDRLSSRFLNIEKERQEEVTGKAGEVSGRFEALERTATTAPAAPSAVVAERFAPREPAEPKAPHSLEDAQRAALEPSGLELMEVRAGDQPFVRCAHCETDNHMAAKACSSCGAVLDTAEQRAFNERIWAAHKAQEPTGEPIAGAAAPAAGGASSQQRALAETLAQEASAHARFRLERDERSWSSFGYRRSLWGWVEELLLGLLDRLPARVARVIAVVAVSTSAALMIPPRTRSLGFGLAISLGLLWIRWLLWR